MLAQMLIFIFGFALFEQAPKRFARVAQIADRPLASEIAGSRLVRLSLFHCYGGILITVHPSDGIP